MLYRLWSKFNSEFLPSDKSFSEYKDAQVYMRQLNRIDMANGFKITIREIRIEPVKQLDVVQNLFKHR